MSQVYQMKSSFDEGITWYQLEWLDVEFREFEEIVKPCDSIAELVSEITKVFPESQLKYKYLGERKEKKSFISKETIKKRKKK